MEAFESGSENGSAFLVKISRPRLVDVYRRERLFDLLDAACVRSVVWVMGPPGAGKTMLVASYSEARKLGGLWYQPDEGDQDLSTLFYFLGLAARKAAPDRPPLPLLTPEYLMDVRGFTRRFFRSLFDGLPRPSVVVLEDYQNLPAESLFHEMMRLALGEVLQSLAPHAEHFLYQTALLSKVTTSMATALAGEARAASCPS